MRKALKIIWKVLVALAATLFAAWMLLQTPMAQTFIARKVAASLEKKIDGRIEFSRVHLKPFNAVVLRDVRIIDGSPLTTAGGEVLDTMARAGSIMASFSLKGLFHKEGIHLSRVTVNGAAFTLVTEPEGTNLQRVFKLYPKEDAEKKEMGKVFDARKVIVEDFTFRLVNLKNPKPHKGNGIDWNDLDINVRELEARGLELADGLMKGEVERLEAAEKSGYVISSLTGKATVGGGKALVEDLRLTDPWSDIIMDEFSMSFKDPKAFSAFLDEVRLTGDIRSSLVSFKSLSYFAAALEPMDVNIYLEKARVDGTVTDLGVDRLVFTESGSGVSGSLAGRITGLPDIQSTLLGFDSDHLSFTSAGLGKFIGGFAPTAKLDLSSFAPGEKVTFSGSVRGTLNNLAVKGDVKTASMGGLRADLHMKDLIVKGSGKDFSGIIVTDRLDLGRVTGIDKIGEITMRSSLGAHLGKDGASVRIDSLFIDKLRALNYEYSNIMAAGTYSDKAFDGRLVCSDPNLNLLFQGIFTLSDKTSNGLYKFYANIGYADLQALGLDKRGVSKVAGRIDANYMRVSSGDIIGDLDILGLDLENSLGRKDIGDIRISSHSRNGLHRINLNSSFADASYVGSKPFTAIAGHLGDLTLLRELPVICKDTVKTWDGDRYDVSVDVHDARDFLSFVMPGLYIADSTKASLSVSRTGEVTAAVKSSRIAMGKNYLRNLDLAFDNKGGSLNGAVTGTELAVGGLLFKNDHISFYASDNHAGIGYSYDNEGDLTDKGEIYLSGELLRDGEGWLALDGKILPSSVWFSGREWVVTPTEFNILGKDISIDNFVASSGNESLKIDGGFSTTSADSLTIDLDRFDMSLANLIAGKDYGIAGLATGQARLISPWGEKAGLSVAVDCDSVKVGGRDVGQLWLDCAMEDDGKLGILASNVLNGARTFEVNGSYSSGGKDLDLAATLAGMDAAYLSPFLSSVFSEVGGKIHGTVRLAGKGGNMSVSSEGGRLENALLKVAFTNVPYHADGPFSIDNSGVHLDGISLRDRYDGTGSIRGGVLFDHLKDIRMDTRISMSRMEAINMHASAGQAIYGNLFATGGVAIKGPFNALTIEVDARTDKDGALHIPIDNTNSDANTNLLTFKEPYKEVYIDPYDVMMNRLVAESRKSNDLGVRIRVTANQRTEAFVEIDRSAGNTLSGRGQGTIDIEVRPERGLFTINGDYTLESGNFHFNALDIAQKDFSLSRGSSIRFNGDVMDSDLDIDGVYTTKASVATLIADTSAVSTRRTVNCGIGISGKLREPRLAFSIDIPDLDPTTKSKVESALNTEDKVQRQFISLLISGGFMPEEQSGIVNNTSTLYTNLAEIMAGQLNSILQKLDIPLDFGLNYQSNDSGTNIFDVAVSTQLFNNRVIVNGNVGNREYGNSSEGDVVGDIDIEIKLDKPGQVRLTLFSHSADDYTKFLDNSQRNGVGVTYQKEFNTFEELVRSIFTSKRKRREQAVAAAEKEKEYNSYTIPAE
ncbi:MAG: translocation/assembly module TamB domain-containing protein [Bacteroidales bacterium]|nr:translocation/assembly module TamB domain-containing protein [Bacteroidales bacterium]